MKEVKFSITSCFKCPNCICRFHDDVNISSIRCGKLNKKIKDTTIEEVSLFTEDKEAKTWEFPKWCPLDDVK